MRWLLATVGILALCAAGVAWIYLRDWERPRPDAAERAQALIDAKRMLGGTNRCGGCRVEVLDADAAGRWRVRVTGRTAARCLWIDIGSFVELPEGGYDGVRRAACTTPR